MAAALISTRDGRSAQTNAEGRFAFEGRPPKDGFYAISATGYVSITVAGYVDVSPVFRLQPVMAQPEIARAPMVVSGRVVDPDGSPRSGVLMTLADANGASGNPALSEPDGRFSVVVNAPGRRLNEGTLLAVDTRRRYLGLALGLNLEGPQTTLGEQPQTRSLEPLQLMAATHEVQLSIAAANGPGPYQATLFLVAPDGTSAPLLSENERYRVAPLPNARYELRAAAADASGRLSSVFRIDDIQPDWGLGRSVVGDTLLAAPILEPGQSFAPGITVRWGAIEGAKAYQLELSGNSLAPNYIWRTLTTDTRAALIFPEGRPPEGTYTFSITAWDAADLPAAIQARPNVPPPSSYSPKGRYRKSRSQVNIKL